MPSNYSAKFLRFSFPSDGVLLLEMNRPPANAFHEEFWSELKSVFDKISGDESIRAIVFTSANPKFFTAGLDLQSASQSHQSDFLDPARRALAIKQHLVNFQSAISSIENCTHPVIMAMSGFAIGLAIDIACTGDIRYAASNTKFSIKEVDVGLAADIGTLARLPKIIGNESLARELALTARVFLPEEALKMGFISRIIEGGRVEVVKAALETASLIASKSPVAVVGTKRLMIHARDHSVAENLDYTAIWNASMLQSLDMDVAIKASKSKQAPIYPPLAKLTGKL